MQHPRPRFPNLRRGKNRRSEPITRVGGYRRNQLVRRLGVNEMNSLNNNGRNNLVVNNANGDFYEYDTNALNGDVRTLQERDPETAFILESTDREQGGDEQTGFDGGRFEILNQNNEPTGTEALVLVRDDEELAGNNFQNNRNFQNGPKETVVPREEVAPVCEIKDIEVEFERRVNVERGPVEIAEIGVDECGNDLYKVEKRKVKYVTGDWQVVNTDMGLGELSGKQYSVQNEAGPAFRQMQMQQQSLQGFRAGKHKSAY
jgi:hypothetical protein